MIKHPSVQATVGKGARVYLTEEKVWKDKKIDTFTRIFGQKVVLLYVTCYTSYLYVYSSPYYF